MIILITSRLYAKVPYMRTFFKMMNRIMNLITNLYKQTKGLTKCESSLFLLIE